MQNDSIETLLLRHYGTTANVPAGLEAGLVASVRQEAREIEHQARITATWNDRRISRRRVLRLVALGSAGLSVVGVGLEGLRHVEAALLGQETNRPAYS